MVHDRCCQRIDLGISGSCWDDTPKDVFEIISAGIFLGEQAKADFGCEEST